VLELLDAVDLGAQVLLIFVDLIHDVLQLLGRDVDEGVTYHVHPLVHLLDSLLLNVAIVGQRKVVLVVVRHLVDQNVVALHKQDLVLE